MIRLLSVSLAIAVFAVTFFAAMSIAGGPGGSTQGPPLDYTLMGFKEQGVWYFPCCAPVYNQRIPPHYLTYGPPPPPYCPPPCAPAGPPPMIRK